MRTRPLLKSVLAISLAFALQGGPMALGMSAHAHDDGHHAQAASSVDSDCGNAPSSPPVRDAQDPGPGCCGALGACPLQSAVTGSTVIALPPVSYIAFPQALVAAIEREVPPDPFPPRN